MAGYKILIAQSNSEERKFNEKIYILFDVMRLNTLEKKMRRIKG